MIKAYIRGRDSVKELSFESFQFPGGEPHIKLNEIYPMAPVFIMVKFKNGAEVNNDLMTAFVLTDALVRTGHTVSLILPYFPGARQDRVEYKSHTALTVKIYADLINAQNYTNVFVMDPHSDVATALINNVVILDHFPSHLSEYVKSIGKVDGIILPDTGAAKRYQRDCRLLNLPVLVAGKNRDFSTGKLSGFHVPPLKERGAYVIIDDICDGGGTFLGLEEEFRKDPLGKTSFLHLWTTHGIYSKGVASLLEVFNTVGCTDSFMVSCDDPNFHQYEITMNTFHLLI